MDLREKLSTVPGSSRKVLKIVLGLSFILLLIWLLTLSYIDGGESSYGPQAFVNEQPVDSVTTTTNGKAVDSLTKKANTDSPALFSNGLIIFFVLAASLLVIWFWFERKGPNAPVGIRREIDSVPLADGANMKILMINEEVWVVGTTSNTVNLLHRYPKDEWKEKVAEEEPSQKSFTTLFRDKL